MLKEIQFKIVTVFSIVGLIIILALGMTCIYNLDMVKANLIDNVDIVNIESIISNQIVQIRLLLIVYVVCYIALMIIMGVVVYKTFISPLSSLIKSAEKATKADIPNSKSKNEIKDLANAFDSINDELKENLKEATRQKKQMETILLHMTDGIIAFNVDGEIIHINVAAKKFMDLHDEQTFGEIFEKYDIDINLEKVMYLENWTSYEQRITVGDSILNLFFATYKNENNSPEGVILVIQDITEHVKLDTMRKRFVADVSHELKTPITTIMGYSETLIESEVDKETNNKFLSRIHDDAERMSKLVQDLLILSKYDKAKESSEDNKTEFDLGELAKKTFDNLSLQMKNKNLTYQCHVTTNVPNVYADKDGIERVIINILTNAIKYTPEGGTVEGFVGFVYSDAYIKIIDTGIGIPEEDLDKIFERFYRVDKARTRETGGTGLGLSIAKEILNQNNSLIDIKSEVGKGTEVVIRIPTKQGKVTREIIKEENTEE